MLSFHRTVFDASAVTQIDHEELEDARWFTREDVVLMLMQLHPDRLFLPPRQAIANRLLTDWLRKTAFHHQA